MGFPSVETHWVHPCALSMGNKKTLVISRVNIGQRRSDKRVNIMPFRRPDDRSGSDTIGAVVCPVRRIEIAAIHVRMRSPIRPFIGNVAPATAPVAPIRLHVANRRQALLLHRRGCRRNRRLPRRWHRAGEVLLAGRV